MGKFGRFCKKSVALVFLVPLLFCLSSNVYRSFAMRPLDELYFEKQVCALHNEFVFFKNFYLDFLKRGNKIAPLTKYYFEYPKGSNKFSCYNDYSVENLKNRALRGAKYFLVIHEHLHKISDFLDKKKGVSKLVVENFRNLLDKLKGDFEKVSNYLENDYVGGGSVEKFCKELNSNLHGTSLRFLTGVAKDFNVKKRLFSKEIFLSSTAYDTEALERMMYRRTGDKYVHLLSLGTCVSRPVGF